MSSMENINTRLIKSTFELAHLLNNKEAIEYLESKYGKIDYMPPKTPLKESRVREIDIEDIEEFDPEEEYSLIHKYARDIDALKRELRFLKYQAPREIKKGGAFESQEEIDFAIKETEIALDEKENKYQVLLNRGK